MGKLIYKDIQPQKYTTEIDNYGTMITEWNDFLEKQDTVQRLMGKYQENISSKVLKLGYSLYVNRQDNYLVLKPKKRGLISLAGLARKIYYANIMPDCLDEIIPINDKPLAKSDIENAESKLEKIAAEMSQPDIAGFAFERGLSLSIMGKELSYEQKDYSIHIPVIYFENNENLIGKLTECANSKPKKRKLFFF